MERYSNRLPRAIHQALPWEQEGLDRSTPAILVAFFSGNCARISCFRSTIHTGRQT